MRANKLKVVARCAKCGEDNDKQIRPFRGGYICERCLERNRNGRDAATRAARAAKIAVTEQATANQYRYWEDPDAAAGHQLGADEYDKKARDLMQVKTDVKLALGEAVPPKRSLLASTLEAPDVAALDASAHRIDLLTRLGNDCAALALDAANSIRAENSLEKMLAHQLAIAHKTALEITEKAFFEADSVAKARLLNLATRMMETFQRGLLTLQRLRTGGEQKIIVQHIAVSEGGQAIVGNVRGGGRNKNE